MLPKARFQQLLQFTRKKERIAAGAFLVEGWRWLEEALALPERPLAVLATPDAAQTEVQTRLLQHAAQRAEAFHEVTPAQLARLTETVQAPGVAALVRWQPRTWEHLAAELRRAPHPAGLIVACDGMGDPGNAGTMIRTADWFGADAVVFGQGSVEPTNPKCIRATMGSLFHLPIGQASDLPNALSGLREAGFMSVGAMLDGDDLSAFSWPGRAVLVIGNEATGISSAVARALDRRVRIPAHGRAESLNAAVAAAVLMADWRRVAGSRS